MTKHEQYNLKPIGTPTSELDTFDTVFTTNKDLIVKDTFNVTDSEMQNLVGQKVGIRTVNANYTALVTDYIIGVYTTTATRTITLPPTSLVGRGKVYEIRDVGGSASSNIITIDANGTETINGDLTKGISTNYGSVKVVTDGIGKWFY